MARLVVVMKEILLVAAGFIMFAALAVLVNFESSSVEAIIACKDEPFIFSDLQ